MAIEQEEWKYVDIKALSKYLADADYKEQTKGIDTEVVQMYNTDKGLCVDKIVDGKFVSLYQLLYEGYYNLIKEFCK